MNITLQPPYVWYQRNMDQGFGIMSPEPFDDYQLSLMYAPQVPDDEYTPVNLTRKIGNGLIHRKNKDIRHDNCHLLMYPKIELCTRKGDRLFAFHLSLSNGNEVYSKPFMVRNRPSCKNTFKSDAKTALRQLEWSNQTGRCHLCRRTRLQRHRSDCIFKKLLL